MFDVPALQEVLAMLAAGVGVGAVVSFLLERFPPFQDISPAGRWWVVFGLSLGLPLAATAALQFIPPEAWALIEPWWEALATGFLVWAGSQAAHKIFNR